MPAYRSVTYPILHRTFVVAQCDDEPGLCEAISDLDKFQSEWWQLSLPEAAVRLRDSEWSLRGALR